MTPDDAMETSATPDGTAYGVAGDGEPLVLVHGVGMQRGAWAPQIARFARTRRVVAYDMLGIPTPCTSTSGSPSPATP